MATNSGGRGVFQGPDAIVAQNELRDLRRRLGDHDNRIEILESHEAADAVVTEQAFGQASDVGSSDDYARSDHTHGTPTDPIPAHVAAADPHTQYALLAGRAGGQVLKGGTAASENLDLQSTANATRGSVRVFDPLVLPNASGYGIKVDTTTPTFAWRDILGTINSRGVGATDPGWAIYRGNIYGYQFVVGDQVWHEFHIPHDYAAGTDVYLHVHWSHAASTVTGGSVTWGFDATYAKSFNQAAFVAPVNTTVAQNASTTQYQHMLAEVQLSASAPSAAQIDTDDLEPDGLILVRTYLSANAITVSGGGVPQPFLHCCDIHYQSTGIGTKNKAANFYT